MNRTLRLLALVTHALALGSASFAADLTPVAARVIGRANDSEQVVLTQKLVGDTLILLPDHCFFSGAEGAKLAGESASTDELNGNKSWARIEGLRSAEQRIIWPLWLHTSGAVTGKVVTEGSGKLSFHLGDQEGAASGTSFQFKTSKEGRVDLTMSPAGFNGAVQRIELSGPGVKGAEILRARWRPAAIHSGFSSSALARGGAESRLWVMEVRPLDGEKGFYSPITTPFGYFGSTFNPDHTSGGINFSMWSFAAGKAEPPLPQLSHLLAVGSPQASFGAFDHEGTGVKLRGWNPYEGKKVNTTALALRIDPGTPYDTYTGYFLDQTTRTWKLYASGRKWSEKRSVENLLPGCFVEVPGPPHIQRTGHILRAADFRGWCRDTKGNWHQIDQMNGSKADANREQTNCLWSLSDDGWFRMGMGGMVHYRYAKGANIQASAVKQLPDYLAPGRLKELDQVPTQLTVKNLVRQGTQIIVEIDLRTGAKDKSKVRAVYGNADALSFEDRWEKKKDLGQLAAGVHRVTLPDAPAKGFCRFFVINETGEYISTEPGAWK